MQTYAHFQHIIAFALLGGLFTFAYPKRPFLVYCIVFGGAVLLEFAQMLTPDRHGTFIDALEKVAGGAAGILLAIRPKLLGPPRNQGGLIYLISPDERARAVTTRFLVSGPVVPNLPSSISAILFAAIT